MQEEHKNEGENKKENTLSKFNFTRNKKFFLLGFLGVLVIILLVGLGFVISGIYKGKDNALIRFFAKNMNIPVASVDGHKISYYDYLEDIRTLKLFYERQQDEFPMASDEEISDQILSRLIINALVADLADRLNIEITEEEVNAVKNEVISQFSNEEDAAKNLKESYGWDLDAYTQKVIYPLVREQKVSEAFSALEGEEWDRYKEEEVKARHILFLVNSPEEQETVRNEATKVLNRLKAGEDFGALAEEFGSDATAQSGGDLGWFGRGVMVPEFEEAVFALEPGQLADSLVETRFGFHIVKVDEKRQVNSLSKYINDKLETADIKILLPIHNPFEKQEELPEGDSSQE